jgi:hypothetical protein
MGIPTLPSAARGRGAILAASLLAALVPGIGLATAHPVSLGVAHLPNAAATDSHKLRNIAPDPDYFTLCATKGYNDPSCIKEVLAAIKHAREVEHVKHAAMVLPRNYTNLTVPEQTFVITNLERVDRGLRPFEGISSALDSVAKASAALRVDASLPTSLLKTLRVNSYGSNWAGDIGPLSADYDWMYNDGYSAHHGINLACATPSAPGCWGHRRNILWPYSDQRLLAGAGSSKPAGSSISEILAGASGAAPKFEYTWKQALRHGADGHRAT